MISPCQEETETLLSARRALLCNGSPPALVRIVLFSKVPAEVQNQTSICGLWRAAPSPKIEFGSSCQPVNNTIGGLRDFLLFAQSITCRAWQAALFMHLCRWLFAPRTLGCSHGYRLWRPIFLVGPFSPIHGEQVCRQLACHRQRGTVPVATLSFSFIDECQCRMISRSQGGCLHQDRLQVLVALFRDGRPLLFPRRADFRRA